MIFTVALMCRGPHQEECQGEHEIRVLDPDGAICLPDRPWMYANCVLERQINAISPQQAAEKFATWQATGLSESFLRE